MYAFLIVWRGIYIILILQDGRSFLIFRFAAAVVGTSEWIWFWFFWFRWWFWWFAAILFALTLTIFSPVLNFVQHLFFSHGSCSCSSECHPRCVARWVYHFLKIFQTKSGIENWNRKNIKNILYKNIYIYKIIKRKKEEKEEKEEKSVLVSVEPRNNKKKDTKN